MQCVTCNYHFMQVYIVCLRFLKYLIVLGKRPSSRKGPRPNFDSSVIYEVLCVTAHHAICGIA